MQHVLRHAAGRLPVIATWTLLTAGVGLALAASSSLAEAFQPPRKRRFFG